MELHLERLPLGHSTVALDEDLTVGEQTESTRVYPVHVGGSLAVDATGQQVLLSGTFLAQRPATCDRCAESFEQRFMAEIEVLIERSPAHDQGVDPDDSWVIHQQRGVVQLAGQLAEAVALAEPQRNLCSETCLGLCPRCGKNLNQGPCGCAPEPPDERWAKLAQLRRPLP